MKTILVFILVLVGISFSSASTEKPVVILETNKGLIELTLDRKKAPITVKNFIDYVNKGFYTGTIFHRVIDNFMIQGGGYTQSFEKKKTNPAIKNEAHNGLANAAGTVAMARTNVVDSATAQFFINVRDNDFLDYKGSNSKQYGYAVFGRVTKGMSVVNVIKKSKIKAKGPFKNLPENNVVIQKAWLKK